MPAAPVARRRLRSWPDAVIALIDRLPPAPWVTYGVVTIVAIGVFVAQRLLFGIELNPVTLGYTTFTVLPIAAMHYANRAAQNALAEFRPALGALERDVDELRRRLTTLGFWPAMIAAALGAGVFAIGQLTAGGLWGMQPDYPTVVNITTAVMQLILNAGFAAFVFHTIAQVLVIVRIHRDATAIELWNTPPHNAFSTLTLVLAIAIVVPYSLVVVLSTLRAQVTPVEITIYFVALALAVALFVLPLSGVRARLMRERTRQFDEASHAFETAAGRLRGTVKGDLSTVSELKDALTGLALEQDRLRKVSTWPWTADTFRGFLTTLGIPLVLWFLTTLLGRVLF